ncbi:MAG: YceI family protein [Bdellovibrionales bacterium]|nr:YceI family protein [Bdellovibrionales bacterium]
MLALLRPSVARNLLCSVCLLGSLLSFAKPSSAEVLWKIAPGRTSIQFKVKHLLLMEVEGRFEDYDGTVITPDETDFSNAKVEATIPVKSIYTGNDDRDSHLLQDAFFHVVKFPDMTFHSTRVVRKPDGQFEMEGNLTIRGVSRPITLAVVHEGTKRSAAGKLRSSFKATGSLNRYDYGLRWNDVTEAGRMLVGDTVQIEMDVTLVENGETSRVASAQ